MTALEVHPAHEDDLARRWAPVLRAAVPWTPPPVPTLVVVPHPDDEVLLAGATIALQAGRDVPVTVVAVTDGEASYPDAVDPGILAPLRVREQVEALHHLGVPAEAIVRLGLPDGGVAAREDDLVAALEGLVADHRLVVAPWSGDHHTDHEACGRAAARTARGRDLTLVGGLFWTWHRRTPADLDGTPVRAVAVDPGVHVMRWRAIGAHASQVSDRVVPAPLLGEADLAPLHWDHEHLVEVQDPTTWTR